MFRQKKKNLKFFFFGSITHKKIYDLCVVPYYYQSECVEKFNEYYSKSENYSAILQMPCGCDKTFTIYLISENYDIVIIISLLKQLTTYIAKYFKFLKNITKYNK